MAAIRDPKTGKFLKGHPCLGAGRPPKDPAFKEVHKLTKHQVEQCLIHFLKMDVTELEEIVKDKSRTVMEHMVGRIALAAMANGDHGRLNFLLERIIGKVTEKVEHSTPKPTIIEMSTGQVMQVGIPPQLEEGEE